MLPLSELTCKMAYRSFIVLRHRRLLARNRALLSQFLFFYTCARLGLREVSCSRTVRSTVSDTWSPGIIIPLAVAA